VPFGVGEWNDQGRTLALLLEAEGWPASGYGDVAAIARQLPNPTSLGEGTLVLLLPEADAPGGVLGRLFGAGRPKIARAIRCSALLARGYVGVGGGIDPVTGLDLAWGYATPQLP
jgi:hypothetical protein